MSSISILFSVILIAIIIMSLVSAKWGVTFFIAYSLLVPMVKLNLGSFSIGSRFMYLLLILIFLLKYSRRLKKVRFRYFMPFLCLYFLLALEIFFQPQELMGLNYLSVLEALLGNILYPMVIFSVISIERPSFKYFLYSLLISGGVYVAYGLFLTTMPGINPYLIVTLPIFGQEFNEAYALGYSALSTSYGDLADGRLFGRISSVFTHPMTYGLNLGLLAIVCAYTFRKQKGKLLLSLAIILVAIVTSGIRTPLVAIGLTLIVALINLKNKKLAIIVSFLFVLGLFIVPLISPTLSEYLGSALGTEDSTTSGSSISMRIDQFLGCFDVIKDNMVFGNGYCWTSVYLSKYSQHPVLLCFESLAFSVLCNDGIMGALIWAFFVCYYFVMVKKNFKNRELQTLYLSLFAFFIFFALITGEYGYMHYFMLYYSVSLGFHVVRTKQPAPSKVRAGRRIHRGRKPVRKYSTSPSTNI